MVQIYSTFKTNHLIETTLRHQNRLSYSHSKFKIKNIRRNLLASEISSKKVKKMTITYQILIRTDLSTDPSSSKHRVKQM